MKKNKQTKCITTVFLSIILVLGGLFHSSCEDETITPHTPKYCATRLILYKSSIINNEVTKIDAIYGYVQPTILGKCPAPEITWKE